MPICGGKECAKKIRDYEKKMSLKPVKIVAISANCCKSEIQETLGTSEHRLANEFLKKPISFDDLKKSVSLCL
jgi:CheY-like chemotaxis protein